MTTTIDPTDVTLDTDDTDMALYEDGGGTLYLLRLADNLVIDDLSVLFSGGAEDGQLGDAAQTLYFAETEEHGLRADGWSVRCEPKGMAAPCFSQADDGNEMGHTLVGMYEDGNWQLYPDDMGANAESAFGVAPSWQR